MSNQAKSDKELQKKFELFTATVDKIYPPYKTLMLRSFVHGVFIGLGTTVGVSIVLALITFTLSQLRIIPGFDSLVPEKSIERFIEK